MKDRFPPWNPEDIARHKEADRGGAKKWKKNRKRIKRDLIR